MTTLAWAPDRRTVVTFWAMRHGATSLLLLILLAGPSAWGKKPPKPPPGPTDADVIAALKTVIAAADQDFSDIKSDFDTRSPQNDEWKTSVPLPGADKCSLVAVYSLGKIRPDRYHYRCYVAFADGPNPLLDRYDALIKLVGQATQWSLEPIPVTAPGSHSVAFRGPLGLKSPHVTVMLAPAPVILAQAGRNWCLTIYVFPVPPPSIPERPAAGSASPTGATESTASAQPTISQEIDTVRSGVYSPLPPIQSSGVPCRNGMCVFGVKNDTAYSLTVLFGGPSEQRVELAPSGSTSVSLLSGSYKIVGRVNAANVAPSYGDYVLDATSAGIEFYIAAGR